MMKSTSFGLVWTQVIACFLFSMPVKTVAAGNERVPGHLEFVSQWFPNQAAAATHAEVKRSLRLASRMAGSSCQFKKIRDDLRLIRDHVGFDQTLVERFTTATIKFEDQGTVIFFTLNETVPLDVFFTSGLNPIQPDLDRFQEHRVYRLASENHDLGLFSADGRNFILGDWAAFKLTLKGNDGKANRLPKLLSSQNAPVVICANPRPAGQRHRLDDPFGTVMSVDFLEDKLAFLMQEEQATPEQAQKRLKVMQDDLPGAFRRSYGLSADEGVKFLAKADGRHTTFAMQAGIAQSQKLLEMLFGPAEESDLHAEATRGALQCVELFGRAHRAGAPVGALSSCDAIVDALCVGIETRGGQSFQLPFLTLPERRRIGKRLRFSDGKLEVIAEAVADVSTPSLSEKDIRRRAQLISTKTMSAAAADSLELKELKTKEEIIAAICSEGLTSGPAYPREVFKVPDLAQRDRDRVAELLVVNDGYLIYRPN